jgi:hypothetical protein
MSGVNSFPDGVAKDAAGFMTNLPAPERTSFRGEDLSWVGGPKGYQPITSTNPNGDIPGVPVMAITAAVGARLAGPQQVMP